MNHTSPDAMSAAASHVSNEYGPTGYSIAIEEAALGQAVFHVRHYDGSEFRILADKYGCVRRLPDAATIAEVTALDKRAIAQGRAYLTEQDDIESLGVEQITPMSVAWRIGKRYPGGWERWIREGEDGYLYWEAGRPVAGNEEPAPIGTAHSLGFKCDCEECETGTAIL